MEEKQISPEESIKLIQSMIGKARQRYTDNSIFLLLWGWIVLIASLSHYYLAVHTDFEQPYIVWSLTFVGVIASMIIGAKKGKQKIVSNYTDKLYGWLWLSLGIAMFTVIFNGNLVNWNTTPFILLFAGVGAALSGVMMNFKPLKFGAICFWVLAMIAFRQDENTQMLLLAIGIALGYLLPGYIMKANSKKHGV
jgi:hypothetical protein